MSFTAEELEEIAAADAEIEAEFRAKDRERSRRYYAAKRKQKVYDPIYQHEYYLAHKGEHRERDRRCARAYYATHTEKCKATSRAWRAKNPNYNHEYYVSHKDVNKKKKRTESTVEKKLNEPTTNWISVQDMLPQTYGLYLVTIKSDYKDDFVTTFTFDTNERRWATPRSHQVTHWMPLPEPPGHGIIGRDKMEVRA